MALWLPYLKIFSLLIICISCTVSGIFLRYNIDALLDLREVAESWMDHYRVVLGISSPLMRNMHDHPMPRHRNVASAKSSGLHVIIESIATQVPRIKLCARVPSAPTGMCAHDDTLVSASTGTCADGKIMPQCYLPSVAGPTLWNNFPPAVGDTDWQHLRHC